jgi:large subunit ribosomal protein L17
MRHRVAHRKLGRVTEHRISLLRNQAQALLRHERIETTVPKAKELRPYVERLISIAKRSLAVEGDEARLRRMNAERLVSRDLSDQKVVTKLFEAIAPRYTERPGGYTHLLRIGRRRGDAAELAQVELVGSEFDPAAADGDGATAEQATSLRGRARAAVKKLQDEGTAEADDKPKRARKSARKADA